MYRKKCVFIVATVRGSRIRSIGKEITLEIVSLLTFKEIDSSLIKAVGKKEIT